MALPEPTTEQLDAAWQELRRRGYRSCLAAASLDQALARPITAALLRMNARLAASGVQVFAPLRERPATVAPEPLLPADPHAPPAVRPGLLPRERPPRAKVPRRAPPSAPTLDRKRAAAGDTDEA